jgi:hypothetical protein
MCTMRLTLMEEEGIVVRYYSRVDRLTCHRLGSRTHPVKWDASSKGQLSDLSFQDE